MKLTLLILITINIEINDDISSTRNFYTSVAIF